MLLSLYGTLVVLCPPQGDNELYISLKNNFYTESGSQSSQFNSMGKNRHQPVRVSTVDYTQLWSNKHPITEKEVATTRLVFMTRLCCPISNLPHMVSLEIDLICLKVLVLNMYVCH